jgi:hypothetical protein
MRLLFMSQFIWFLFNNRINYLSVLYLFIHQFQSRMMGIIPYQYRQNNLEQLGLTNWFLLKIDGNSYNFFYTF